jgi:hypothetical protein
MLSYITLTLNVMHFDYNKIKVLTLAGLRLLGAVSFRSDASELCLSGCCQRIRLRSDSLIL